MAISLEQFETVGFNPVPAVEWKHATTSGVIGSKAEKLKADLEEFIQNEHVEKLPRLPAPHEWVMISLKGQWLKETAVNHPTMTPGVFVDATFAFVPKCYLEIFPCQPSPKPKDVTLMSDSVMPG